MRLWRIFKSHLAAAIVELKIVTPRSHLCNAAKRAIITSKNNFISGLCRTNTDSPLNLWYQLITQVLLALNLL